MRLKRTINNKRPAVALLIGALMLLGSSCAGAPRQAVSLSYAPTGPLKKDLSGTVTLANLFDKRDVAGIRDLGDRDGMNISANVPAAEAVTQALAIHLKSRGYKVRRFHEGWDGEGDVTWPGWSGLLIGGSLDEFSLKAATTSFKVEYTCVIKLRLVYADASRGEAALEETIEVGIDTQGVRFSLRKAAEIANAALSGAVEKALADIDKRYKDVTKDK